MVAPGTVIPPRYFDVSQLSQYQRGPHCANLMHLGLDHRLLLFCQYIERLEIDFPDGRSWSWTVKRETSGKLIDADIAIEVEKDGLSETFRYRRWAETWVLEGNQGEHLSVAVCLVIDEQGQIKAC